MMSDEKETKSPGGYWSAFFLGALFGVAGFFLLGTKKGRDVLKKTLELSEDLEEKVEDLIGELKDEVEKNKGKGVSNKETESSKRPQSDNLSSVLKKIKSAMPGKKETKKYFVKDGKLLK